MEDVICKVLKNIKRESGRRELNGIMVIDEGEERKGKEDRGCLRKSS